MLSLAFAALAQIFTAPFRHVLIKTLALTLLFLILIFVGAETALGHFLVLPYHWLATSLIVLAAIALLIGFAFAITPVSFLVAGFFFDELAAIVEAEIDPAHRGKTPPLGAQIRIAAVFAALALALNIIALLLLLVPGVNAVIFLIVNAYLFGRGYFELAALRYRGVEDVGRIRRAHEWQIFLAGLLIAALAAVPVANLLTPLFGAALMVRVHNKIAAPAKA
ncbi:EI24 domain-containing protein [uncultured Methylovirgula sp.]|uniref:EI24 domain-containing protein n=1 Tax=uncultured Methylovirgula sp. TaxID=1285960 RepID=UPI00261A47CD|nr:EI24 domain-containing protein [uncultured Methylovirgula sp.]